MNCKLKQIIRINFYNHVKIKRKSKYSIKRNRIRCELKRLFCFGLGYTSQALANELLKSSDEWLVLLIWNDEFGFLLLGK